MGSTLLIEANEEKYLQHVVKYSINGLLSVVVLYMIVLVVNEHPLKWTQIDNELGDSIHLFIG